MPDEKEEDGESAGGEQEEAEAAAASDVEIPFGAVVEGSPAFEVCRVFAATLQLVNDGNVQLLPPCSPEQLAEGVLRLRLLDARRRRGVEDFRAPSLQEPAPTQPAAPPAARPPVASAQEPAPAAAKKGKRGAAAPADVDENEESLAVAEKAGAGAGRRAGRRRLAEANQQAM